MTVPRSMYIDSVTCVIFILVLYTFFEFIWMYDIFQQYSDFFE